MDSSALIINTLYTKRKIDLLKISKEDIDIKDIAKSLANSPLFSACINRFYSFAEYSLDFCSVVGVEYKLGALLFNAHFAYMDNNARYLMTKKKYQVSLIIKNIRKAIQDKYNVNLDNAYLKKIDLELMEEKLTKLNDRTLPISAVTDIETSFNDTFILNNFLINFSSNKKEKK